MEAASTVAPAAMPQHMQALAHANRVRLARASLKREIATGAVDAAEIVRECPWEVRIDVGRRVAAKPAPLGTDAFAQVPLLDRRQREPRDLGGSPVASASCSRPSWSLAEWTDQAPPAGLAGGPPFPPSTRGGRQAPAPQSFQGSAQLHQPAGAGLERPREPEGRGRGDHRPDRDPRHRRQQAGEDVEQHRQDRDPGGPGEHHRVRADSRRSARGSRARARRASRARARPRAAPSCGRRR